MEGQQNEAGLADKRNGRVVGDQEVSQAAWTRGIGANRASIADQIGEPNCLHSAIPVMLTQWSELAFKIAELALLTTSKTSSSKNKILTYLLFAYRKTPTKTKTDHLERQEDRALNSICNKTAAQFYTE